MTCLSTSQITSSILLLFVFSCGPKEVIQDVDPKEIQDLKNLFENNEELNENNKNLKNIKKTLKKKELRLLNKEKELAKISQNIMEKG